MASEGGRRWTCAACTYANPALFLTCEMCQTHRDHKPGSAAATAAAAAAASIPSEARDAKRARTAASASPAASPRNVPATRTTESAASESASSSATSGPSSGPAPFPDISGWKRGDLRARWAGLSGSDPALRVVPFYKAAGPRGCFSNFWRHPRPTPFTVPASCWGGSAALDAAGCPRTVAVRFSEASIMLCKAALFGDALSYAAIAAAATGSSPAAVKKLGRGVGNFHYGRWSAAVLEVAVAAVHQKFAALPVQAGILLGTGRGILAEATRNDKDWGIGVDLDDPDSRVVAHWNGNNILGFALIVTRERLRAGDEGAPQPPPPTGDISKDAQQQQQQQQRPKLAPIFGGGGGAGAARTAGVHVGCTGPPTVHKLTADGASSIEVWPQLPAAARLSKAEFAALWALHPPQKAKVVVMGVEHEQPRWSQCFIRSYTYSGVHHPAAAGTVPEGLMPLWRWVKARCPSVNQCLINWYLPAHKMGAHSDDERGMLPGSEVFSFSYGGDRLFRITAKAKGAAGVVSKKEVWMRDNTLIVMRGSMQRTHKHEVTAVGASMSTSNRINVTFRSFERR